MPMDRYACTFTCTDVIAIPGVAHGRLTADLCVMVWETEPAGTKRRNVTCAIAIDDITADVLITLGQPTTGRVVIV